MSVSKDVFKDIAEKEVQDPIQNLPGQRQVRGNRYSPKLAPTWALSEPSGLYPPDCSL